MLTDEMPVIVQGLDDAASDEDPLRSEISRFK